jgi:methionyl-tRNA synthetase
MPHPILPMQSKQFVLWPSPPTPNGRLHLGHMAGPYMRMDALARYLRSIGHQAAILIVSDMFDSYVLWKAHQEGVSPQEVSRHYHEQMSGDFAALDIDVEVFLCLEGETARQHVTRTRSAVEQLVASGRTTTRVERVMYCPSTERYLVGVWLQGKCPVCEAEAGGYFCERCGALFRPETMLDPRPRLGDSPIEWREVETLFVRLDRDIDQYSDRAGAPPQFAKSVERYVATQGPFFPLTAPGTWGIEWIADRFGNPRVLFEAGWELATTCGAAYAEQIGHGINPFRRDSPVTTVTSFGIDNSLCLLCGTPAVMSALNDWKPFDFTLANFFYTLEGEKFSTSRGHAIWTIDIIAKTPATSDAVRFFLARENPEKQPTNFSVQQFVHCVNDVLVGKVQKSAFGALRTLGDLTVRPASGELSALLQQFLCEQDQAFSLGSLSLARIPRLVESWVDKVPGAVFVDPNEAHLWLKGLALLAAPLMPRFASRLWSALGHCGDPVRSELHTLRTPCGWRGSAPFEPLSVESLAPCLPKHLVLVR